MLEINLNKHALAVVFWQFLQQNVEKTVVSDQRNLKTDQNTLAFVSQRFLLKSEGYNVSAILSNSR